MTMEIKGGERKKRIGLECCSKKHESEQPTVPEVCSDLSSLLCGVQLNIMAEGIAFFLIKVFNDQADKIKGVDDPISEQIEYFTEMLSHHSNSLKKTTLEETNE